MPLEHTFAQIDQDISSNALEKARDRLHGLLTSHPNNLDVRQKLGEVYWQLEQPETAGRYWFLIEATTPEMVAASFEFANACNNDSLEILRRLEFKGNVTELESGFSQFMLLNLKQEAQEKYGADVDVERNQEELDSLIETTLVYEKQSLPRQVLNWSGCILALVIPFLLIVWGTVAVIRWLV